MKKINKFYFLSSLLLTGLVGCATPVKYNYTQQNYKSTDLSYPEIGEIVTATVGETMLQQGKVVEKEVLVIPKDFQIDKYLILTAGKYEKIGFNDNVQIFLGNNSFLPEGGAVLRRNTIDSLYSIALKENNKLCALPPFGADHCNNNKNAYITKVKIHAKDSFQQSLIYNGRVGNKINIGYREFSSDYARPAFSNNVEYDLNDTKQIGYKGAMLEVIDANNQQIKYKILKNFNNAK
ncbi:hypothetical protein [Acinetobacter pittii]|uniref:Lipoprotein n=1 Tax=Acinetobacter pittii ANC 4050 TaxID=1217691 RepID=R8YHR4_ACIPI|nr:hypothetical protein [Acinetobacter pittii]EOQ68839.1 hypothetical protein F931_01557 [Acinetobacter pittii ANC 4050]